MKEQQYNEMCGFLANDKSKLNEFKSFYGYYGDSENYDKLFENKYGFTYRKLSLDNKDNAVVNALGLDNVSKQAVNSVEISENNMQNDIKIIRQWVQFFGWVTIIGIVISVIAGISMGLS